MRNGSLDGAATPHAQLPLPTRERWQPLRGGLLNIYKYDYEEFHYEHGRLLLRGNNGTGKSRVLALQLPFLFDGEVAPHRVEPDGDPAKRIEWNLLLGKHKDRLGYTWIEFGRKCADGADVYLTLGCGLSAVDSRGIVGKWFFVTDQRVGESLYLQGSTGSALTKDKLREALGERGKMFLTAADYRDAVDQALFKLGERRYAALINLLIQLRQPQLSRSLDEKRLSAALSDALPPVSPTVLVEVAEAFKSLENDRNALGTFMAARGGVEAFLVEYRRYAQIAARRRAEAVRVAHAAYESGQRGLRDAETERESRDRRFAELTEMVARLELEERAAASVEQALASSPEMTDVQSLGRAKRRADELEEDAGAAAKELGRATHARTAAERERLATDERVAAGRLEVVRLVDVARTRASDAGLDTKHSALIAPLALPDGASAATCEIARKAAREAIDERSRAIAHVHGLNDEVGQAARLVTAAKQAHEAAGVERDRAVISQRDAETLRDDASAALVTEYRVWASSTVEIDVELNQDWEQSLLDWCQTADGASPMVTAARRAFNVAVSNLSALRAETDQRRTIVEATLSELRAEHARLRDGHHRPPLAPYTRDVASRVGRAGAPLWLLCDFRPDVTDAERAGIEAALEASGLLDAWVTPEGGVLPSGTHDTAIALTDDAGAPTGRRLSAWLQPSIDREDQHASRISNETIRRVLEAIGGDADSGPTWVDPHGLWRVGPLRGAWAKPASEHIGHTAREIARRRRLAEIEGMVSKATEEAHHLALQLDELSARQRRSQRELDGAPHEGQILRALADLAAARTAMGKAVNRLVEAESRVATRRAELDGVTSRRDMAARDLHLEQWVDDLRGVESVLGDYRNTLAELWPTVIGHAAALAAARSAQERLDHALDAEGVCAASAEDLKTRAAEARAEYGALEGSIGAAVAEILARLEEARKRARDLSRQRIERSEEKQGAAVAAAVALKAVEGKQVEIEEARTARDRVVDSLARYAYQKMLAVADTALADTDPAGWSVTRAVEVARRVEALFSKIVSNEAAWDRTQRGLHSHIQTLTDALLPHDFQPATTLEDEVLLVSAPFRGKTCTMAELSVALQEEVSSRQSLLDEREREVLENHLIGEVSSQLHDLLHAGESFVRNMNEQLKSRPTSTGMTLRFAWEPAEDGPIGLDDARRRLLRTGATWSDEERRALGEFLQRQIHAVRNAREMGTWQEHLSAALDYRAWHRFSVERQQDGIWKKLTKRTHGTGSGGEKAIALTMPQFAAASAHYESADRHAPRLILLDEAFVGIDTDMRAKCMGLLAAFDLDFVMTSEREWGCYATLPGVAIYQLVTRPGVDAVGVSRWVWNGQSRLPSVIVLPSASAPDASLEA